MPFIRRKHPEPAVLHLTPTPPRPPPSNLVDYVADAYDGPNPRCRTTLLPRLLASFFPTPDRRVDASDIVSTHSFAYLLQHCYDATPDPTLRACLRELTAEVARAANLANILSAAQPMPASMVIETQLFAPLRRSQPVLWSSGYANPSGSHAVVVTLIPETVNQVRLVVHNRGEGHEDYHSHDPRGRPQPLILTLESRALGSSTARATLTSLIALQRPAATHTVHDFYGLIAALQSQCAGMLISGRLAGQERHDAPTPTQTPQVAGTCSTHGLWSWLQYRLEAWYRQNGAGNGLQIYKQVKQHCRSTLLKESLDRLATAPHDSTLNDEILRIDAWLRTRRDQKPYVTALEAQLHRN